MSSNLLSEWTALRQSAANIHAAENVRLGLVLVIVLDIFVICSDAFLKASRKKKRKLCYVSRIFVGRH